MTLVDLMRYRLGMTLGEEARRLNDDRDAAKRAGEQVEHSRLLRIEAQLIDVVATLAREVADAARGGRWRGPRSWNVPITYSIFNDGDRFAMAQAHVTVFRDGTFNLSVHNGGRPDPAGREWVVDPVRVRADFAKELAKILDGK
jgi:hypothetical protein